MAHYLVPHTPEWFERTRKFDPQQATQTAQMIDLAGSEMVCSICGDEEAADYYLDKRDVPADAVLTLRLCSDCKDIRQGIYGEHFLPFPDRSAQ